MIDQDILDQIIFKRINLDDKASDKEDEMYQYVQIKRNMFDLN